MMDLLFCVLEIGREPAPIAEKQRIFFGYMERYMFESFEASKNSGRVFEEEQEEQTPDRRVLCWCWIY